MVTAVVVAVAGTGGGQTPVTFPCGVRACRTGQTPVPLRAFESAYVAADPRSPDHVVVTDADLLATRCAWHTSFDGGKHWIDGRFELPAGYSGCRIDPPSGGHVPNGSVGIGSGGRVYAVFGSASGADPGRESVMLAISTDGGRTFGPAAVAVAPPGAGLGLARLLMTVVARPAGPGGASRDILLVSTWECHVTPAGTACDQALFSRSDDAGATFSAPVVVNQPPGGQNPSQPAMGADGTIYVLFQRRFSNGPVDLLLARSSDNGVTFTESKVDTEQAIGVAYDPAKLVVDPKNGALCAAWSDSRVGSQQIFFRMSKDQGRTWAQATLLSPDPNYTGSSRSPSMDIAADGRIDVAYYHTSPGTPNFDDVYLDSSTDGGANFAVVQVNSKPVDRSLGYSGPAGSLGEVGNYYPPAVSSLDSVAYVAWSDTANATPLTHTQDVRVRTIPFAAR